MATTMDIEKLLRECKKHTYGHRPIPAGTTMSMKTRSGLEKFCAAYRLSLRQGIDLAVYLMLKDADMLGTKEWYAPEESAEENEHV